MGCEITICSFVTAPLTSHSQPVPDRRKELFLFVTVETASLQYCTVDGSTKQLRIRSVYQRLALLLVSLSQAALEQVQRNLAPRLCDRLHWNRSRGTLLLVSVTGSVGTGPKYPLDLELKSSNVVYFLSKLREVLVPLCSMIGWSRRSLDIDGSELSDTREQRHLSDGMRTIKWFTSVGDTTAPSSQLEPPRVGCREEGEGTLIKSYLRTSLTEFVSEHPTFCEEGEREEHSGETMHEQKTADK
uniref:Uncharacterized protein n=1 Tax=Timema bartmani TaxID=61472 RepID=A0A7R9F8U2_9NEOP|nr:unnamed protein product [Timema bartmani]